MPNEAIEHVLAVGAHPDDIEILCAGTLVRFAEAGAKISIITVQNGDKGALDIPEEEIAEIRRKECLAAAAVIGAEWIGLAVPDGTLVCDTDFHIRMIQAIQGVDPDLIITHAPNDYMSDHTETSKAVTNASFYTVCPQFSLEGQEPAAKVVPIYYMDTVCGVDFAPQEYVDIAGALETKLEMYSKHESQHKYLSEREGVDFFDIIKTSAHYRGLQCGAEYAEAFRRYDVWPRTAPRRHLP